MVQLKSNYEPLYHMGLTPGILLHFNQRLRHCPKLVAIQKPDILNSNNKSPLPF